jgi:Family of unknown function (DUF5678)
MQLTTNELIKAIQSLPKGEQEKIRKMLEKEELAKRKEVSEQVVLFKASEKWLKENRAEYLGQWVCLLGDELIAHGANGLEVHRLAKEKGIKSLYLVRVIEESEAFSGAWI